MAIDVLERRDFGGQAARSLGTGLAQLFDPLVEQKLQSLIGQKNKAQLAQTYSPIYGEPVANFLAGLSEKERVTALQNPQALANLAKVLGAPGTTMAGEPLPAQRQKATAQEMIQEAGAPTQKREEQMPVGLQPDINLFANPREQREQEKVDIKREQLQRASDKEIREYLEKFSEKEKAAKKDIRDYKLLDQLAKTPGGIKALRKENATLERLGIGGFFRSPTAEIIEKVTGRLAQNAGAAFGTGTRITNFLEKTFQRSIPSLLNTLDGFKSIVKINKYASQAIALQEQARRDIIKENNNRIPTDIDQQIENRTGKQIQELEQKTYNVAIEAAYKNSLPPVTAENKGSIIEDPESGFRFKQEGKGWKLLQPEEEEE